MLSTLGTVGYASVPNINMYEKAHAIFLEELEAAGFDTPRTIKQRQDLDVSDYPISAIIQDEHISPAVIDTAVERVRQLIEEITSSYERLVELCDYEARSLWFPDADAPARIHEMLIHAVYADRLQIMQAGGKYVEPSDMVTYVQLFNLAGTLGFNNIQEQVIYEVRRKLTSLVPNTETFYKLDTQFHDQRIRLGPGLGRVWDDAQTLVYGASDAQVVEDRIAKQVPPTSSWPAAEPSGAFEHLHSMRRAPDGSF